MIDTATKRRPDMTIYFVAKRENAYWVPIGAAWLNKDGEGYSLRFDLIPTGPGDIVLRKPKPKAETEMEAGA